MIDAYPLKWPKGWLRSTTPQSSRFKTSLSAALKNVNSSLKLFGADSALPVKEIVISSNVSLGNSNPKDAGVAVWFLWEDKQLCIAVDRYKKVEENLQAIHLVVESRRTELRHGGLHLLRQAFAGFKALPEASGSKSCWDVLGIEQTQNKDLINGRYRELSKTAHPNGGGTAESFLELQQARDHAIELSKQ